MRITVLLGGTSAERDVSIASGVRIAQALRGRKHQVVAIDPARGALSRSDEEALLNGKIVNATPPSADALTRMSREVLPSTARTLPASGETDVVFIGLHGGTGEDGTIQALLDLTGVPYTGSGHLASALAMDKDLSKRLFRAAGVQTADWLMAPASEATVQAQLGFPVIVKPSKQGSTVGLTMVKRPEDLQPAIVEALRHDDEVMIERFIPGRELTVGILGDRTLPVGEIIPKHEIYDYECKYTAGMAEEIFPAKIPEDRARAAQEQARLAFTALKLRGCARVDFRMTTAGELYCLEVNTLPGMTELSLIPQAAAAAGISFPELCERIVMLAFEGRS